MKKTTATIIGILFVFGFGREIGYSQVQGMANGCYGGFCPVPIRENENSTKNAIEIPPGVVRIFNAQVNASRGLRSMECGSGAVIEPLFSRKLIMTASHLFRDGIGNITAVDRNGNRIVCDLTHRNELWDIAILQPRTKIETAAIPLAKTPGLKNETAFPVGFGPDEKLRAFSGKILGYSQIRGAESFETIKMATPVRNGDSGGPVLNSSGELIGVVWGTDGNSSYATYIGRIKIIIETAIGTSLPAENNQDDKPENQPTNEKQNNETPSSGNTDIDNRNENNNRDNNQAPTRPKYESTENSAKSEGDSNNEIKIDPSEELQNTSDDPNERASGESQDSSHEIIETDFPAIVLAYALGALGLSCPPSVAGFVLLKSWLQSRLKNAGKNDNSQQVNPVPNTTYPVSSSAEENTSSATSEDASKQNTADSGSTGNNTVKNNLTALNDEYAEQLNANYELSGRTTAADATLGRLYDQKLADAENSSSAEISKYAKLLRKQIAEQFFRIHSTSPLASEW